MNWDEWVEKYKPILDEGGEPKMFETYGAEVEFVKSQPSNKIWTLEDAGDGPFIMSGWHFVNRIGYYISEIPFEEDVFVDKEEDEWDDDENEGDSK